jgi:hypothetical protein
VKPLDRTRVTTLVDATGRESSDLNDEQLDILSIPLHLQLFVKAASHPDIMSFTSPDELYACWNSYMREVHG